MNNKPIVRTTYFNPITNLERQGATSNGESRVDQEQYEAPLEQAEGVLHDWGIGSGLSASGAIGSPGVLVAPGVALDSSGRHISLAAGGMAEVNPNAVAMVTSTLISVSAVGAAFDTTNGGAGDQYLTIEWRETFDQTAFNASLFQMKHTPWLRLTPVANFSPDGSRLVVARLTLDAAGNVTALSSEQRVQTGLPVGSVKFWKAKATSNMPQQLRVDNLVVGEIRPHALAGLTISADAITVQTQAGAENFMMDVVGGSFGRANGVATLNLFASQLKDTTGDNLTLTNPGKVSVETPYVRVGSGFTDLPLAGPNHVQMDVNERVRFRQGGTAGAGLWFYQTVPANDRAFVGMASDTQVGLLGNSGAGWGLLMDTTSGRIGIGTNAPGFRLDVANRMRVRQGSDGSAGIWFFQTAPNADRAFVSMASDTQLGLYGSVVGWGLVMDTTNGNIGIGTNAPGFRLDVASRMRVRQGNSPSAGIWFFQTTPNADRGFVGMVSDTSVGLWGNNGAGWGFQMNTASGVVTINAVGANSTGLDVTGTSFGLCAHTKASTNWAALALPGGAAIFSGNVQVSGTLSKSAGTFLIDHPLDPDNKFLRHAFVESPEMMNVYSGICTTNGEGLATVDLPAYFDALNKDIRYQLTPIGQLALAAVIGEAANCKFQIKTDKPNVKVSWMVTGVRKDAYALAHPVVVEEDKQAFEQGHYIHPKLFGKSISTHLWKAHVRKMGTEPPPSQSDEE